MILLDGSVAGFWRRTLQKRRVVVEAELIDAWSRAAREALRAEADRFGAFLGLPAELSISG